MEPTAVEQATAAADVRPMLPCDRPARRFAITLFLGTIVTGAALALSGAPFPGPGPVLVLALLVALAVNHVAFFSSELAATSEAAVMFAAVVIFRSDALLLGPLSVALLVGPLDLLHWKQRSFVRMAYNAGSQGFAVIAAAGTFGLVRATIGSSLENVLLAALVATVPYVVVDSASGVALLWLRHEEGLPALARHLVGVNWVALPLAVCGAAAGYLYGVVGWWAALLALAPATFVPELVLVRLRRRRDLHTARAVLGASILVGGFAALAALGPTPDPVTLAVLVALGALAGLEFGADAGGPVASMVVVVVVAAAVVADDATVLVTALVAVCATLVGCTDGRLRCSAHAAAAGTAGVACALVYTVLSPDHPSVGAAAAALLSALLFAALVARRRSSATSMLWTTPIVATAVSLALAWRVIGTAGVLLFGPGLLVTLAASAWWGAPPWRSRALGRWPTRRRARLHRLLLVGACTCAIGLATGAVLAGSRDQRAVLVCTAAAAGETAAAMAALGVRQWRFAPNRRVRQLGTLLVATGVVSFAYPGLALDATGWSMPVLGAALAAVVVIAWPIGRLAEIALVPGDGAASDHDEQVAVFAAAIADGFARQDDGE